jgi:predicted RNA binding protein YcfA (HicA-like mRNA interferase family)
VFTLRISVALCGENLQGGYLVVSNSLVAFEAEAGPVGCPLGPWQDRRAMTATELLRILRRRATRLGLDHSERPAKGGHIVIRHGGRTTTVPVHSRDMPTGTFRAILRQLGLSNVDLEH